MAGTTPKSAREASYSFARMKAKVRAKLRMMKIQGIPARCTNPAQSVANVFEEARRRLSKRKVLSKLTGRRGKRTRRSANAGKVTDGRQGNGKSS